MDHSIFNIVKKYVDQMDYYALLAQGSPKDEFDIESAKISSRISHNSDVAEIATIIADVFSLSFGEEENAEDFMKWAIAIKKDIEKSKGGS